MLAIRHVDVDGVRSAVHDSGPASSPEAVVFLHGNPGPMDDWEPFVPEVASFARAIAIDVPGFGRADHPRRFDFSPEGYAKHLGAVLSQLGVERAHLVLHDFGSAWGLRWAIEHPESFASVTLVNCGLLDGYRWHSLARIWQTPGIGELFSLVTTARTMHAALERTNPRPVPFAFVERIFEYSDWNHKRAVLALYRASRDLHGSVGVLRGIFRLLDRPACVIWGEADAYLPATYAEKQKEFFPSAEVHVLPGLGHWPFVDDPAAVAAPMLDFLRRQVGRSDVPVRSAV